MDLMRASAVAAVVLATILAGCSGSSGPSADAVFDQMVDAGLPIEDGVPSSKDFQDLAKNNICDSSRTFVRTDADVGWGLICVDPSNPEAMTKATDAVRELPALVGPLLAESADHRLIIFGLGWPADSSKRIAEATGATGNYLAPS